MSDALPPSTITVMLPHYRCEPYLAEAISSILSQVFTDLTLVVVDDHSCTDGWYDIVRTFAADPRFVVFQSSRRVGPYALKNAVLSRVMSPYVAFQDADDVSKPMRLRLQEETFRRQPAFGLLGTGFVEVGGSGPSRYRRMPAVCTDLARAESLFMVHHPTAMVRTHILRDLGGFDASTIFGADEDFLLRAMLVCQVGNVDAPLYVYRRRADSLTMAPDTGMTSAARQAYRRAIHARFRSLHEGAGGEYAPDVLKAAPGPNDWQLQPVSL